MAEKFTREQLKSGYVVKLRSGELRLVCRAGNFTKILVSEKGDWSYLSSGWNDDLEAVVRNRTSHYESCHQLKTSDIVEVYGLVTGCENYGAALTLSIEHRVLLWKRQPAVKLTLDEVIRRLGYEIELVAGTEN